MTAGPRISRFETVLLAAMFVTVICLPLCKQMIFGEPKTEMIEGRRLNLFPEVSWKHFSTIKEFPAEFERYYNDHFGFRAALLHLGSYIGVKYANVPISPDVLIGKAGWLFLRTESDNPGDSSFTDLELEQWKRTLERRQEWLARKGIQYLFVIPPDKQTVYPEFLPDKYSRARKQGPAARLMTYLAAHHSTAHVLYLNDAILEAKGREKERLYFRNDTHWNPVGAFAGYSAIMDRLRQWYPDIKPMERSDFRLEMESNQGDLSRMMEMPEYSSDNEPSLKPIAPYKAKLADSGTLPDCSPPGVVYQSMETPGTANRRRAVLQRDSFMVLLGVFVSESFARSTYLSDSNTDLKSEKAVADFILKEKPDIFIEERLERFLLVPPSNDTIVFGGKD